MPSSAPPYPMPSSPSLAWLPSYLLFLFSYVAGLGTTNRSRPGRDSPGSTAPPRRPLPSLESDSSSAPPAPQHSTSPAPTLHYHRISSAQIISVHRSPRTPNSLTLACIDPDKPAVHGAGLWPSRTPGAVWHQVSLNNFSINKITGFALACSATRILLLCTARAAQYPLVGLAHKVGTPPK